MWFERVFHFITLAERSIFYPIIFLTSLTYFAPNLLMKWGIVGASILQSVFGLKLFRMNFGKVVVENMF